MRPAGAGLSTLPGFSARDAASLCWTLVKIAVIELRQLRELRFVEHHHAPAADIDDFRLAQLPDDTIGMDRRDPQRLCNLLLRKRHFECVTCRTADDGKAMAHLQDKMGEPAIGWSLAAIDDPCRKMAASISESRQNFSATFGLARVKARSEVWLIKPSVDGTTGMRS